MKTKLSLVVVLFSLYAFAQKNDTLFFDKDWKETSNKNASFYRLLPLPQIGKYCLIRDYYKNGNLQAQGYVLKSDEKEAIGDFFFYDEDGVEKIYNYSYPSDLNESLTYFYSNGKVWKKTSLKDGVLNGKTTYYDKEGSVLMDGLFENENAVSGNFPITTKINWGDYKNNNEKDRFIYKEIYWENTRQLAQQEKILISHGKSSTVSQKNFDKSGKIIQQINESAFNKNYPWKGVETGTAYTYFTKNDFAVDVKKIESYTSGEKDGLCTYYDRSGKIENKISYKNGQPFEGLVKHVLGINMVESNFVNGEKTGEEIARTKNDSIISKGIYKNGKPFEGTFLSLQDYSAGNGIWIGGELLLLKRYANFKEDGLQLVFKADNNQLIESYFLKNGLKEGVATTVDANLNRTTTAEYKNGEPFEGVFKNENIETAYKNGKLMSQKEFKPDSDSKILAEKFYENGKISKTVSKKFIIEGLTKDEYVGIYKNEKPFSGYFDKGDREFNVIDYFEEGVLKYQFSSDWFEDMKREEKAGYREQQTYNLKATFKGGKVFNGNEYIKGKGMYVTKKWEGGIIKAIDFDFFAENAFTRLHYEIKAEDLEISELRRPEVKLVVNLTKNGVNKTIFQNGKRIMTQKQFNLNLTDTIQPNTSQYYMEWGGKIIVLKGLTLTPQIFEVFPQFGTDLISKFYSAPVLSTATNTQTYFLELSNSLTSSAELENYFSQEPVEANPMKFITELIIDASGKPKRGISITPDKENTFSLKSFSKGAQVEARDKITLQNIWGEVEKMEPKNK